MADAEDKPKSEYEVYSDLRHFFAERAASQQTAAAIHMFKGDPVAAEEAFLQARLAQSGVKLLDDRLETQRRMIELLR